MRAVSAPSEILLFVQEFTAASAAAATIAIPARERTMLGRVDFIVVLLDVC